MTMNKSLLNRRKAVHLGLALAGGSLVRPSLLLAAEKELTDTPENVLGPFYPMTKPLDKDADLTMIGGRKERALGKILHLTGRVLNMKGEPVRLPELNCGKQIHTASTPIQPMITQHRLI